MNGSFFVFKMSFMLFYILVNDDLSLSLFSCRIKALSFVES